MAQPPAVIVQAYEPAGRLQLYRLGEQAPFYCVHCCHNKTDSLVATTHDNWAKTICKVCYDSLVHRQEAALAKARKTKQQPVQAKEQRTQRVQPTEPKVKTAKLGTTRKKLTKTAGVKRPAKEKQQPSRKVKAQQEKEKLLQLAIRREQQLQRQLPGVDQLLTFFRAAGVRVEVGRGRRLLINGVQTRPLTWTLPSPERISWNHVIDEMALKYTGRKFLKAVADNARFGEGLRAFLRPRLEGFAIMRDGVRLAIIRATGAEIPQHEVIHGNFLRPGPHWQQVADVVHGAEAELVAQWKREQKLKKADQETAAQASKAAETTATEAVPRHAGKQRIIAELPDYLAPEFAAACLNASRRIRLERQVAYERPVVLQWESGKLTLLPIVSTLTRLLMPFLLDNGAEALQGRLVLGDRDPLPLLIGETVPYEDAVTAWTCALLGFADATCIELESAQPTGHTATARPKHLPTLGVSQRRPSARNLPRKRPWPTHLEPVGDWVRYSGTFVAGHRRRLNDDQTASFEAHDRARQVGIILQPHETWVRPHTRGIPDGIEMRFRWHAPSELKLSHA
jgi:hypothetical protein